MVAGLVVAALLLIALGLAAWGPAPRRAPSGGELRALLAATFTLYGAAVAGWLLHRAAVAEAACAAGVAASALAGWLSRGSGSEGGAEDPGGPPVDSGPPVDWDGFDDARRGWDRHRTHRPAARR